MQVQLEADLTILYPNQFDQPATNKLEFNEDFMGRTESFVCRVLRPQTGTGKERYP